MLQRERIGEALEQLDALSGRFAASVDIDADTRTSLLVELDEVAETVRHLGDGPDDRGTAGQRASAPIDAHFLEMVKSGPESYLVTDQRGVVRAANGQASQMLGVPLEFLPGKPLILYLAGDDHRTFLAALAHLAGGDQRQQLDVRLRPRTGELVPISMLAVASAPPDADPAYWWVLRDDTERRSVHDSLALRANYDALTGLMNRASFVSHFRTLLRSPGMRSGGVAVLFIDLDRFKAVNDTFGHDAGSQLLHLTAGRISAQLREHDLAGRIGGDEFVVVLGEATDRAAATTLAERIRVAVSEPVPIGAASALVTATVGVAVTEGGDGPEDAIAKADRAMYVGKERGRNRVHYYSAAMRREGWHRKRLAHELERALRTGNVVVHYQPEFDLVSGQLVSVEALARWRSRDGLVPAEEFIATAETGGLIQGLGAFVLARACEDAGSLDPTGLLPPVTTSVNISPTELRDSAVVDVVLRCLDQSRLAPEQLCLEITERGALEHLDEIDGPLRRLRAAGVRLAIDDFGVGHSSLSRLRELPVDIVKIDRSFVSRLPASREDRLIVSTVCELADMLGLVVVAEGIETAHQLTALRSLGCRVGQGHLLGMPVEAGDVTARLGSDRRLDMQALADPPVVGTALGAAVGSLTGT